MYASSWMLLRPFWAMNGWLGTLGAETGLAFAAVPIKAGTEPASGPSGIGWAGTAAAALAQAIKAATAVDRKQLVVRDAIRTVLPRSGMRSRGRAREI